MKKASISISRGRGSLSHNHRVFSTKNVDSERTKNNIVYENISLKAAYEYCFEDVIENYNKKQKRKDRQINGVEGYMDKIRNSKNGEQLFYEIVVQVGNKFDSAVGTDQGELCKKILDEYMDTFQERNPNLFAFNAVMHLDEETPHLHIDFIPIANGYQKGMYIRNSLDRALKLQGIDGKSDKYNNSTMSWFDREKNSLEEIMQEHGLARAEETGLKRKRMSVEQFKAVMQKVDIEIAASEDLSIESKPTLLDKEKVTVKADDLAMLEQRAKLSKIHEDAAVEIINTLSHKKDEVSTMLKNTSQKLQNASEKQKKANELYNYQKDLNEAYIALKSEYEDYVQSSEEKKILELLEKMELEKKLELTQTQFDNACNVLKNTMQAINLIAYGDSKYRSFLNDPAKLLIQAVDQYVTGWLNQLDKPLLAYEVEKKAQLSSGIQKQIDRLDRKKQVYRDDDLDR